MSYGYRMWGWIKGPLAHASVTVGVAEVQLLDSSNADRTPKDGVKTLVITNPSTNAATKKVYIIKSGGSTSAFLAELKPGDAPFVVDIAGTPGVETFFAIGSEAAIPISVAQGG